MITPLANLSSLYKKYERWVPAAAFILGFCFDILMLSRIDDLVTLIQQLVYLIIITSLIGVEIIGQVREVKPPNMLEKIWPYREFVLHFLLGSLLSSYVIFYFLSASGFTSFLFILGLAAILTVTEFKKFGDSQVKVHMALASLCLISFSQIIVSILLGFVGVLPFLLALALSFAAFFAFYSALDSRLAGKPLILLTNITVPFTSILVVFVFLYATHTLPPIPLSVSYMSIYHGVEKKNGKYHLATTKPWWKFWQQGDEVFYARPGDSLVCFAQVFSPTRFKDKLQIRWLSKNALGNWEPQDAIPLEVSGGREEGFRIAITKKNYHPGRWRVQIETTDNREVGWQGFTIVTDTSTTPRTIRTEMR